MHFEKKDFGNIGNKWEYSQSKNEVALVSGEKKIDIKIKNNEIWVSLNNGGKLALS